MGYGRGRLGHPVAVTVSPLIQSDDVMAVAEGQCGQIPYMGAAVGALHPWLAFTGPVQIVQRNASSDMPAS